MLKSILSLCITAALGLLIFALVLPAQANEVAHSVLGNAVTIDTTAGISTPVAAITKAITSVLPHGTTPSSSDDTAVIPKDDSPLSVENIIDATNNERIKAGLPPLKASAKLEESAKIKTEDMITNQYFEHTSPSGKTVADLGNEVGYDYVVMGENLALGDFSNANDLLQAWMNSPGHRANILNTSYEDIGVYAAQGTYQGRTVWFAVQHFGTERGVCPSIDTALKSSIDSLNATVKQEETAIDTLRTQIEDPNHANDQTYSNLIVQFNALVATYNANVTTSQQKISTYNAQVVAFNKCLSQYQVSTPSEAE
jgi:uncharacterized protein YkwD